MKKSFIIWGALCLALVSNCAQAQEVKGVPDKERDSPANSFLIPTGSGFQLSPDGKHIAFFDKFKEVPNVFYRQSGGGEIRQASFIGDFGVEEFYWIGSNHLVYVTGGFNRTMYVMDIEQNEFRRISSESCNVRVIHASSAEGVISFEMNSATQPFHYDFYTFNKNDKDAQLVERNDDGLLHWAANSNGGIAFVYKNEASRILLMKNKGGDKFIDFANCTQFSALESSFANKGYYYCLSNAGRTGSALMEIDVYGSSQPKEIFSKPGSSIERVFFSPKDHRPIMAWYRGKENGFVLIDKNSNTLYSAIKSVIPGKSDFQIVSSSIDENVWIVAVPMNDGSLVYYRYNVANKELKALSESKNVQGDQPKQTVSVVKDSRGNDMLLKFHLPVVQEIKYPTLLFFRERIWAMPNAAEDSLIASLTRLGFPILELDFFHSSSYGASTFTNGYDWWSGMILSDMSICFSEINKMFPTSPGVVPCGIGVGAQVALRVINVHPELKNRAVFINPILDVNEYATYLKRTANDDVRFLLKSGELNASELSPLYTAASNPLIVFSSQDVTMMELIESSMRAMALSGNTPEIFTYSEEPGLCKMPATRDAVVSEITRYALAVPLRKMK
jgi:hypothetical protein